MSTTTEKVTPRKKRPTRPILSVDGDPITIEKIRASLARTEPGQGIWNMEIDDIYAAPFYLEWLLDRLEEATKPKRRKKPSS